MKADRILYEDKDIIVCHKPAGIATQTAKVGSPDMVSEITDYLVTRQKTEGQRQQGSIKNIKSTKSLALAGKPEVKPYIGLIHRLDQPVEGILVFAKNKKAAARLSAQLQNDRMEKYYLAVVRQPDISSEGAPISQESIVSKTDLFTESIESKTDVYERVLADYLYQDKSTNTSYITDPGKTGAKLARLSYQIIKKQTVNKQAMANQAAEWQSVNTEPEETISIALLRIHLLTGRHHQIRVQLSNAGLCLFGDYKYADEETKVLSEQMGQRRIALCAYELAFLHPVTGKRLSFKIQPEGELFRKYF